MEAKALIRKINEEKRQREAAKQRLKESKDRQFMKNAEELNLRT